MVNILVVDDMDGNLTILEYLIEDYMKKNNISEYKIEAFTDPKKAIQIVQNKKVDIVFLDVMMPYLNGFEFLQIVRRNSDGHQPIIVMVTALAGKKTKEKNQEYGANAYVIKPIKANIVHIMLDRYLEVLKQNSFHVNDRFEFQDNEEEEKEGIENPEDEIDIKKFYDKHDVENVEESLEEINNTVFRIFDCGDEFINEIDIDLQAEQKNIEKVFKAFQTLFSHYDELEEFRFILGNLILLFENYKIKNVDQKNQEEMTKVVKSLIIELMKYKEKAFIECSIDDLYYIKPFLIEK